MKTSILVFVGTIVFLLSLNNRKSTALITYSKTLEIDSLPGSSPYFTKDNKGNIVISWVRAINDSTAVFCYAVSTDNGKSFNEPKIIPPSTNIQPHAENLPKLIVKPSGEIIALWGSSNPNSKNKYAGLVFYSQSFDDGKSWTERRMLVNDTAGNDQRYYDIASLPNNEVAIIWLDNRKKEGEDGSALYFANTRGRYGFQDERMIATSCCPCCRTDLFIDKSGVHVLYRGIIQDSIRDMLHAVSVDGGKTFSTPKRINSDNWILNGCPHTGPSMTANKRGLHFAWFTGAAKKGCYYSCSRDNGNNFDIAELVATTGSHPQIAACGEKLLVAWDETVNSNNRFFRKIGVQLRDAAGRAEKKEFITADTSFATYPVIMPVDNQSALVAYTVKENEKHVVKYQWLHF